MPRYSHRTRVSAETSGAIAWDVSAETSAYRFAEEDAVEAVLVGPVRLDVSAPRVVGEVLGHRRVGVEADLAQAQATGVLLGPRQQAAADPAALGRGPDGQVLYQQVAGLGDQDHEAADLAVLHGDPGLSAADRLGVVGAHRSRRLADPGHIGLVSLGRDAAQYVDVTLVSQPDGHGGNTWQVTAQAVAL